MRKLSPLIFLNLLLLFLCKLHAQTISGELKKWHRITLTYEGPTVSETDSDNPFLNYRLNVTFTSPTGTQYVIPGFFAADGNAANTGMETGNKWQVRFAANETGTWLYSTSFRYGDNVAISPHTNAGNAVWFNGTSGSFTIAESDKTGNDNRAKGRLQYIGQRYLRYEGSGEYFLKGGADSPENFLAYTDFDNTRNNSGTDYTKSWSPHIQDWNHGDPVWKTDKGKGIIGAINYLSERGMNVFSFLTMNVSGDGDDVWPWITPTQRTRYDVSKLEQWEYVFDHADSKGMYLHFKLQEIENDHLLDGGNTGTQRKLYIRELIARFGHHLALNWNIGEENDLTSQQQIDMAAFIKNTDAYNNHIVMHTWPGEQDLRYTPLLGNNSELTGASIQMEINAVYQEIKTWVTRSENAGKPWVVASDEIGPPQTGVAADSDYTGNRGSKLDNQEAVRKKVLWATFMAGGTGVEYYFGYETGETDLSCQDYRSRENMWATTRIALDFFRSIPFYEMKNSDALTSVTNDYCFSKEGELYTIYLPEGGTTNINLGGTGATYQVNWFDPRNGGALLNGSVTQLASGTNVNIGTPPNNSTADWVAVIKKTGDSGNSGNCEAAYTENEGLVVIEAENLTVNSSWLKKSSVPGHTGTGYITWEGADYFHTPGNGLIQTQIKINRTGVYRFQWRSKVGKGTSSTEHNDSWIRFPDASDFYAKRGTQILYPKGSGKSPNPDGGGADGWFKAYLSGTTGWTWSTLTNDGTGYEIFVVFDSPGVYTMELSARSTDHLIDRIILHNNVADPTDLSHAETPCQNGNTPPDIQIDGGTANEGGTVNFPVFLTHAASEDIRVTFSFSDITTNSEDFDHQDISRTIPAGQTSITISVPTVNDVSVEENETFNVAVKSIDQGQINDYSDTAIGTIIDNDSAVTPPDIIISNTTVIEGNEAHFPVSLTQISQEDIQITFSLNPISAQVNDFNNSPITQTILAGQKEITISVPTTEDTLQEEDETFRLSVASVNSGTVGDISNTGIATILDNDGSGPPDITLEDATVFEGDDVIFSVFLSNPYEEAITINFQLQNETASNSDYNASSVSVTVPAGQTTATLSVSTYDDTIFEGDETFVVRIANISQGQASNISDTARATIIDNDTPPNITINNSSAEEGKAILFELNLDESSIHDIVLELALDLGTADASDLATGNILVTIPTGTTTATFAVETFDDAVNEDNETFTVYISGVQSGTVGDISDTAIGIIINNDGSSFPNIILEDASGKEGEILKFPVKLSQPSNQEISMTFTFINDTGTESDYTYTTTSVKIPAGETETTLDVKLLEDDLLEEKETFNIRVAKIERGSVNEANDSATGTIIDNTGKALDFSAYPNPVNSGGTTYLKGLSEGTYTVTFATMRGELLFQEEINVAGHHPIFIPQGLRRGVYILSVYKENEISSEKIIIH